MSKQDINITVGADPEFFLLKKIKKKISGGWANMGHEYVSAHDLVPGTKLMPHKMTSGSIQADGTAVEFNIEPADTALKFSRRIRGALNAARDIIPEEYEFSFTPSVRYPTDYFNTLPLSAKEVGCSPDYRAHYGCRRSANRMTDEDTNRCAGGHIHVGWGKDLDLTASDHWYDCQVLIQAVDNYFKSYKQLWDNDTLRYAYYGEGGAFRPKTYGAEYRGLSNAWLKYPKLWPWIFESIDHIFKRMLEGDRVRMRQVSPIEYKYDNWGHLVSSRRIPEEEQIERLNKGFKGFPEFPADYASELLEM